MLQLLNLHVDPKPGHLLNDWDETQALLSDLGLDGIEIAPHGMFDASQLPRSLTKGLHLSFFPVLAPFWDRDDKQLLAIFDNWKTVEQYYGSLNPDFLVETYVRELDLAAELNLPYVVFHPANCDMDHLFDFKFPWHWQDTLNLSAELLNAALAKTKFTGKLLFENLWWPSSFRLDSRQEYDYLRERVNYSNCGLCFDTGHMMATNTTLLNEKEGVAFLMTRLHQLDLCDEIETVHLNANLNGAYIEGAKLQTEPYRDCESFWHRLDVAIRHVTAIDSHSPFVNTSLAPLLEMIAPKQIVHELAQSSLAQWQQAIRSQKKLVTLCC